MTMTLPSRLDPEASSSAGAASRIPSRRELLRRTACGFGSLALGALIAEREIEGRDTSGRGDGSERSARDTGSALPVSPLLPRAPHHAPRAKRVIFLFMQGGPSHVDTFDYKPRLERDHGKELDFRVARTRKVSSERVMRSPWRFARHGACGHWVSELFPHVARHVDDLCFLHGVHTEGVAHGPATLFLHTGATNLVRPSVGSWITYGLGTENQNMPGFVTIQPSMGNGGPRNWANAFLPAAFQGTPLGRAGSPASDARIRHLIAGHVGPREQERRRDLLRVLQREQSLRAGANDEIDATIESFELAFRMQADAPHLSDLSGESDAMRRLYGLDEKETAEFGQQCLLARRLLESGVRYVQVNYADNGDNPRWDQHSDLPAHATHARAVDKPIAGLLADLRARGLLEDTLVWWGGEFGRNPFAQDKGTGRDHNPDGFTVWLAGAGVRAGYSHGETDEFGHRAIFGKTHVHDLHATVLWLLGLDHERLTWRSAGRDFRLTDVHGEPIREILA
jgi:hypothetical protein